MKYVTRTFVTSKIIPAKVFCENGNVKTEELEPVEIDGKVTTEKAIKAVQKKYGKKNQYCVLAIEESERTLGLPIEKFLELAKPMKISDLAENETEEN